MGGKSGRDRVGLGGNSSDGGVTEGVTEEDTEEDTEGFFAGLKPEECVKRVLSTTADCISCSDEGVYLVFLRAFSRALEILLSHEEVFFPGFRTSILERAERTEEGRSALGDGGLGAGSLTAGGAFTSGIFTALTLPSSSSSSAASTGGMREGV